MEIAPGKHPRPALLSLYCERMGPVHAYHRDADARQPCAAKHASRKRDDTAHDIVAQMHICQQFRHPVQEWLAAG